MVKISTRFTVGVKKTFRDERSGPSRKVPFRYDYFTTIVLITVFTVDAL